MTTMRDVFIFTRTYKHGAQWCLNPHGNTDRPLFTRADAEGIRRLQDPRIAMMTFTVEAVG